MPNSFDPADFASLWDGSAPDENIADALAIIGNAKKPTRRDTRKGDRHKSNRPGKYKSSWGECNFIAWDGEGKNLPAHNEHGDCRHIYTYLANSVGGELHDDNGLSSEECLELLCDCAADNKKAIYVVYGGSYDMNMILRDIPKEIAEQIAANDGKDYVSWGRYAIRLVQRKYLAVARYKNPDRRFIQKSNGKWERDFDSKLVLWDVIGFFQVPFIQAVEGWLGKDWPDLNLIKEGKAKRTDFASESIDYIRRYNAAELRALVELMTRVWQAMDSLGLKLSRWDGAGAVAAAMNQKHNVKDHIGKASTDKDCPIQQAFQYAYFGGRIELGKYGCHTGTIYHYDINSAYPAANVDLPQMSAGRWIRHTKKIDIRKAPHLSCFLIEWDFSKLNLRFNPFPYRSEAQRKVLFPARGKNWIWKPEALAAYERYPKHIKIVEAWYWIPANDYKPYYWLAEYYERRKMLCDLQKKDGIIRGEEKVLKLGYNSCYGKTAQRAGYNEQTQRIPPYHNLAYAGYITSATRAKLWAAADQKQDAIIALATDGIFSLEPLDLYCPPDKELGAWEAQTHDGMVIAQSGFYWLNDDGKWSGWSRGFDKVPKGPDYQSAMENQIAQIKKAWRYGKGEVFFPCTRFITIKTALSGEQWWSRWCSWYSMRTPDGTFGRRLKLTPQGTKRIGEKGKPHKEMVSTIPEVNYTPHEMSMLYDIPWISLYAEDESIAEFESSIGE